MTQIPSGFYFISKGEREFAILKEPTEGYPVNILDEEQLWEVVTLPNSNATIKGFNYIGYEGPPENGKPVVGTERPIEWRIQPSAEPTSFHVVVPGGPVGGTELAFDRSPALIFPPQTILSPLNVEDQKQTWKFTKVEN